MSKPNYNELYNVCVEWNDTVDVMDINPKYIGDDGNPFGFTKLEEAIQYRDIIVARMREKGIEDAKRVYVIIGERVMV